MALKNAHRALLIPVVPCTHPQQQAAPIDLFLQMAPVTLAKPARQKRTDQAARATRQGRAEDGCGQRTAGSHDRSRRRHGTDIHEDADQPTLGTTDGFRRDVGGARNDGIVRQRAHLPIAMAEFLVDRLLAGEEAELGAVKARLEQLVDGGLQRLGAVEDTDGFSNDTALLSIGHGVGTPWQCSRPVLEGQSGGTMQYRRLTISAPFSPTLRRSKASRMEMRSTDR
jgi:hypothetical protein